MKEKENINQLMLDLMNRNLCKKYDVELFKKHIDECDLNIQNIDDETPIMYILRNNYFFNIFFTKEKVLELMKKSDFEIKNKEKESFLFIMIKENKNNHLNFTIDEMYPFLNGNMAQDAEFDVNLFVIFVYHCFNDCPQKLLKNLWMQLEEEKQQKNFQILACNKKYEVVNFLLYDCLFQPSQQMIEYFQEEKRTDILGLIKTRNILVQLGNELNTKEEKVLKSKI